MKPNLYQRSCHYSNKAFLVNNDIFPENYIPKDAQLWCCKLSWQTIRCRRLLFFGVVVIFRQPTIFIISHHISFHFLSYCVEKTFVRVPVVSWYKSISSSRSFRIINPFAITPWFRRNFRKQV